MITLSRKIQYVIFSYESFFEDLEIEGLKYVIRINVANNPILTHEKGEMDRVVKLDITPGKTKTIRGVYYKGNVKMNLSAVTVRHRCKHFWMG